MNFADIVELGKSLTKKGVVLWQGVTRLSDDDGDVEPLGEGEVFQGLGLSSMPYPADKNGKAEAVALRGVGGRDTTYVGARDTRSAAILGNLQPGDTCMHSTGPQQAAQVQCKEKKRQSFLASKNRAGKTILAILDGERDTFEVVLGGMILQMDAKSGSFCVTNGQASIIMQGGTIALDGDVIVGGKNAKGPVADAQKVEAELSKLRATIGSLTAPSGGGPVSATAPYVMAPVGAPGASVSP